MTLILLSVGCAITFSLLLASAVGWALHIKRENEITY